MADAPAATARDSGGTFGFLTHRIAGKVPVWVVAVAAAAAWYWYKHYGPGKTSASSTTNPTATSMTDPAGNVGVIDPATGFVYGSPEDLAALSAGGFSSNAGGDTSGGSSGDGGGVTGSGGGSTGTVPPDPTAPPPVTAPPPGSTAPAPVTQQAPPAPAAVPRQSPSPAPTRGQSTTSYTVQKGDTLSSVAAKYHISVTELAHSNVYVPGEVAGNKKVGQPLGTGAGLKTGQVLKIP